MSQVLLGLILFVCGLGFILFNKSVAQSQKALTNLFGMGTPSLQFYRVGLYIVGTLLGTLGIVFIFFVDAQ